LARRSAPRLTTVPSRGADAWAFRARGCATDAPSPDPGPGAARVPHRDARPSIAHREAIHRRIRSFGVCRLDRALIELADLRGIAKNAVRTFGETKRRSVSFPFSKRFLPANFSARQTRGRTARRGGEGGRARSAFFLTDAHVTHYNQRTNIYTALLRFKNNARGAARE
jgi:hypothetical protein